MLRVVLGPEYVVNVTVFQYCMYQKMVTYGFVIDIGVMAATFGVSTKPRYRSSESPTLHRSSVKCVEKTIVMKTQRQIGKKEKSNVKFRHSAGYHRDEKNF